MESNNTGLNCELQQNANVPEGIDYLAVTISRQASGRRAGLSTVQNVQCFVIICAGKSNSMVVKGKRLGHLILSATDINL